MSAAQEKSFWIWMASLPGMGAKTFYALLKEYGSAADFFNAVSAGNVPAGLAPTEVMAAASSACSHARVTEILAELSAKRITAITRLDDDYPPGLRNTVAAAGAVREGNLPALDSAIGIVGTRACTRRGFEHARKIAAELGVPIVSAWRAASTRRRTWARWMQKRLRWRCWAAAWT